MEQLIDQQRKKLDYLFDKVGLITDEELKAHWSKYLCILTSGLLENSVKIILNIYASRCASPVITNYINFNLKTVTNLKDTKIRDLLSQFNENWKLEYEKIISDEQKEAIDAVIANRHNIAHGKDVGLTYVRMKNYYANTLQVINIIKRVVV